MKRPSLETVDRIVAVALTVIGQLELWIADAVPGPKWVAAPVMLVMTGAVAFRRRWPLASGSAVLLANGSKERSRVMGARSRRRWDGSARCTRSRSGRTRVASWRGPACSSPRTRSTMSAGPRTA